MNGGRREDYSMKFDRKKGYCCSFIQTITENAQKKQDWKNAIPILYSPKTRAFTLMECSPLAHRGLPLAKHETCAGWAMIYCPNCGAQLPTDLHEEWRALVRAALNIDDTLEENHIIPQEFQTDEWWKNRGL